MNLRTIASNVRTNKPYFIFMLWEIGAIGLSNPQTIEPLDNGPSGGHQAYWGFNTPTDWG